jgi:amidase
MHDLAHLDAIAQAELVRCKQVKPIELVEAAIERIERLNPQLNAVVTPMYELARAAASGPLPDGPFAGVPFLLKDLTAAYAGVRMTSGSRFLRDYIAPVDSELVVRYKRAGLIVVGKTNTPEFGLVPTTEPVLFGPTRNPWDTTRTPGGSSGGSAAAVASGMVPAAHGNDGGGSIRIPASCCGLFGLKPTRGRNPLAIEATMLSVEHVLTRSVRDSAALLDATQGAEPGDPYHAPAPARPYLEEVGADPGKLRIALTAESLSEFGLEQDCIDAVRDTAKLCESLGHHVEEVKLAGLDDDMFSRAFDIIWSADTAADLQKVALLTGREPTEQDFEPLTWALAERGARYSAGEALYALRVFQEAAGVLDLFMSAFDVWLTPTLGEAPVPLGTFDSRPDDPIAGYRRAEQFVPFTPIANVGGQPAMSVPLYWNAQGLPIGTHFVARFGNEATLFRLAAQLEQARPWAERRPPVFAS